MITASIYISLVFLAAAALLALYRLLAGPTILDRVVAFDMVAICIVGMMVLLSVLWRTQLYIELMLIFSLLGFVGTVAFVSYLQTDPARLQTRELPPADEEDEP